jgi:hypothetical protein
MELERLAGAEMRAVAAIANISLCMRFSLAAMLYFPRSKSASVSLSLFPLKKFRSTA